MQSSTVGSGARWASRSGVIALLLCGAVGLAGCAASRGASLYRAGSRALAQGDTARAITDLEAANALLPGRSEILNHLGIAYDRAGRSADALSAFERAVAVDCRNAAAESNLVAARQRVDGRASAEAAGGERPSGPGDAPDPKSAGQPETLEASDPITRDDDIAR